MISLGALTLESYGCLRELALSDPTRLRAVGAALLVHSCLAIGYALVAFVADRRYRRPFGWPYASLGTIAIYVVAALELVEHQLDGEGGLRAMSWFFGILIGMPSALLLALLTTWWVVGKAGVSARVWSALCAPIYVAAITMHGLAHW